MERIQRWLKPSVLRHADDRYRARSVGPLRHHTMAKNTRAPPRVTTTSVSGEQVAQSILFLRGQRVILDRELAAIYGVETRALNQAIKRNMERFPEDFMF